MNKSIDSPAHTGHAGRNIRGLIAAGSIFIIILLFLVCLLVLSFSGFLHIKGRKRYWDHTHFLHDQWKEIGGRRYRFDHEGNPYEGWYSEGRDRYYLRSGIPRTGMIHLKGRTYYFNNKGVMARGFREINNATYCFSSQGNMLTGISRIKGQTYIFQDDGRMLKNCWVRIDSDSYYLHPDGHAAEGRTDIKGRTYFFEDQTCRLLTDCWIGNCYVNSKGLLQKSKTIDGLAVDSEGEKIYDGEYGSGGSLYIPSLGLQVPLYETEGGEEAQVITDQENSAALLTCFRMPVIADHKNQGFDAIKASIPDETLAFLLTEHSVKEYLCSRVVQGTNTAHDILDENGRSIDEHEADLCLYTCNQDWQHVTIVLFLPIHSPGAGLAG